MTAVVLAYHSHNIAGSDYATNDPVALASDLDAIDVVCLDATASSRRSEARICERGARFVPSPAVSDRMSNLLAGRVDIVIPQPQDANEHIASGKLRPIAAITERRLGVLPDVPTIREQGIAIPIIANAGRLPARK